MRWSAIFAAAIAMMYAAYSLFYPTTSYRFKLTLNVETPEGLKTGSSVMEVQDRRFPAWTTLGGSIGQSSLTGEAVFVDLGQTADGKRQNVIALLALGPGGENVDFYLLPGMAFGPLWKNKVGSPSYRGSSWELPQLPVGTRAELRGDLIPTLTTFSDLHDLTTARAIRPSDFSQAFGNGFAFRDMIIEIVPAGMWPFNSFGITGEPITTGIEGKLPWWNGPFPWLRPLGGGVFADTRTEKFKVNKENFKR